ncbi:MAG: hypothetical protein J0I48_15025 [Devosia sp.]|uniref:hypothetical protein n=1 Tax=Devosia sp. 66-22 TaxID=1895753 RepID=UPI000ABED8A3|nr:hypothetical protein [Devosia sp. 66-22]MBN9347486.1 hypothetical protein [Devosia sp.]
MVMSIMAGSLAVLCLCIGAWSQGKGAEAFFIALAAPLASGVILGVTALIVGGLS